MRIDGERVYELRWQRGMSRAVLSKASGVSSNAIYNIEKGNSGGYPQTARRLARALAVEIEEILLDDNGNKLREGHFANGDGGDAALDFDNIQWLTEPHDVPSHVLPDQILSYAIADMIAPARKRRPRRKGW
jgi:transcriptional regulator with XRE-family HTH domain